ncbi:MAG: GTPase [Asgard group archaeon]|nr:GTPase [Asgard group archaeon]
MYTAFIVGTAGSGKSFLTSTLAEYMKIYGLDVATVNMDPGVLRLPYAPDIDVREYININEIMTEYELGPNGGLVAAVDLITSQSALILEEVKERSPDIMLIDTPGQMELFAFRPTGVIAANELGGEKCVLVNLMDANQCREPYGLINTLVLAMNVQMRFFFPQINLISKIDLLDNNNLEELTNWLEESYVLEEAINNSITGERRELAVRLFQMFEDFQLLAEILPISAKTNVSIDALYGKLQLIWQGGEDFQVEDRVVR